MLDEIFEAIENSISEEDKLAIIKMTAKDLFKLHFGLGLWLRNNFLWKDSDRCIFLVEEIREKYPKNYNFFVNELFYNKLNEIKPNNNEWDLPELAHSIYFPDQLAMIIIHLYQQQLVSSSLDKALKRKRNI